jgi:5-methylcytosine-specific restriction endonuclease McrA
MPTGIFPRKKGLKRKKGGKRSEETKKKMSQAHKGLTVWNKGKKGVQKHSEEVKEKLSGSNSVHWLGGIASKPYSTDWTKTLRRSIRERDNYTCQVCGKQEEERTHDVHHIDYDKNNSNIKNLITLCNICHAKTNHNREKWIEFFDILEWTTKQ